MDYWEQGSDLDRADAERADPRWLADRWAGPSRLLLSDGAGNLACTTDGSALRTVPTSGDFDPPRHLLLGVVDGEAWFTTWVEPDTIGESMSLRRLNANLSTVERDLASCAVAITGWITLDPRCPSCGAEPTITHGGFMRTCPGCGRAIFPRTDPAVIVAILDDEHRLLLGHQASWPEGRMSVFAGFLEAGESLEQAVHREMAEEIGMRLASVEYFGSQPWPFPRSLMIGFVARAVGTDVRVDGKEIVAAEWFTPQQLAQAIADDRVRVPGPGTIARRMLDAWLSGRLGGEPSGIELESSW